MTVSGYVLNKPGAPGNALDPGGKTDMLFPVWYYSSKC